MKINEVITEDQYGGGFGGGSIGPVTDTTSPLGHGGSIDEEDKKSKKTKKTDNENKRHHNRAN